jgi:hypothetical protein
MPCDLVHIAPLCMQDLKIHHHHNSANLGPGCLWLHPPCMATCDCGSLRAMRFCLPRQLKITTSSAGLFLSDSRSRGRHVALLRGTRGPWSLAWEPTTGYGLRLPHAGSRIDAERCELILVVRGGSGDDLRLLQISTVWSGAEWDCRRQGGNELRDPVYWPLRCDRLRNDQVSFETT